MLYASTIVLLYVILIQATFLFTKSDKLETNNLLFEYPIFSAINFTLIIIEIINIRKYYNI